MTLRFLTLVLCISAQLQSAQKLEKWTQLTATGEFNPLTESASVFIFIDKKTDTEGKPVKDCFSCTFFDQQQSNQIQIEQVSQNDCIYNGPELYRANEFAPDMLTRFLAFQKQTGNWLNIKKETLKSMLLCEERKIKIYKKFVLKYQSAIKNWERLAAFNDLKQLENDPDICPNPFLTTFYTELLALKKADLDATKPPATPFISALQHRGLLQSLLTLKPTTSSS